MDAESNSQKDPPNEPQTAAPTSTEPATGAALDAKLASLADQQRAYDEAINSVRMLMSTQTPYQAPQPKQLDADKILTNPDEWQRDLVGNVAGAVQQMMTQQNAGTFEALSTSARHLSRSDPKVAPVWDKYGEEIEALANSPHVNPQLRGSKEFWDQATRVVQAQHLDDIVAERAQALAAEMRTTAETGGGSYGASDPAESSAMDKLRESPYGKKLLEKYGERGIMRNVEKLGVTLDKYADMVADTHIIVNPSNPSEWHNRDLMRGR